MSKKLKIASQDRIQKGNRTPIQITSSQPLPLKLTVLEKWPKWSWISISQNFKEWKCHEGEKKWSTDACPYFYHVFSLPSPFVLPLSFLFSFLVFNFSLLFIFFSSSSSSSFSLLFPGYLSSFLYLSILWDFSLSRASPTIFGILWASLQTCPLTHWLPGRYLCSECACCITLYSQTKFFVLFLPSPPFLPYLQWIRTRGFHYTYPYGMHQVALALLTFFGRNTIPARHFSQKKPR